MQNTSASQHVVRVQVWDGEVQQIGHHEWFPVTQPHVAIGKCHELYRRFLVWVNCNHSLERNAILKCQYSSLSCGGGGCMSGVIGSMKSKAPGQLWQKTELQRRQVLIVLIKHVFHFIRDEVWGKNDDFLYSSWSRDSAMWTSWALIHEPLQSQTGSP